MYNKSSSSRSGGYKGGQHRSWNGGGRDGGKPMMHGAICNKCKSPCEVPFRPNGKKPIFCSNCFKRDGDAAPQSFNRESPRTPRYSPAEHASQGSEHAASHDANISAQLTEINDKLDALIEALSEQEDDEDEDADEDSGKK